MGKWVNGISRSTPIIFLILTIMKVELGIKTASNVVSASGCPKYSQSQCGIMYRSA